MLDMLGVFRYGRKMFLHTFLMYFVSITVDLFLFYPNKVQVLVSQKKKKKKCLLEQKMNMRARYSLTHTSSFFMKKFITKNDGLEVVAFMGV